MVIDKEIDELKSLTTKIGVIKNCLWPRLIKRKTKIFTRWAKCRQFLAGYKKGRANK